MDDGHEYIGVFLRLEECQHKRVMASFRFSWVYNLDDTDEVIQYVETPCAQLFYKNKTLGYAKFLDRNVVMETLRAFNQQPYDDDDYDEFDGEFGNLHLVCEIKVESQSEELDLRTMGRYVYGSLVSTENDDLASIKNQNELETLIVNVGVHAGLGIILVPSRFFLSLTGNERYHDKGWAIGRVLGMDGAF
ncbi:unnamed protein product [Anisakis simplex]|uniref:DUF223 domain-containing protein n=1 Tax=Anisakis simplex TaxID=6269 RepID=A0A0M3J0N6_ANISI|nr:unnamed protein product [Anisakis simplex]